MPALRLRAFAKINLGLRILSRRPDHYHEIRTVYQAVSLADHLEVAVSSRPGGIVVEADDPTVPSGSENLAYKTCERWRQVRGGLRRQITIRIEKGIPAGSGLGGASSDAAATLLALERLTGDRLTPGGRLALASGLGSDVPFFLLGGRALGCGRGEEVYPLPDLRPRQCLIVFPGFAQSTAEAYAAVDSQLTAGSEPASIYSPFGMWPQFPWEGWGPAENDFERVVFAKWPELQRLKQQLLRAGAEMALLSGSGTAVYAIFDSARKLTAARARVKSGWRTFAVRTLARAEYGQLQIAL